MSTRFLSQRRSLALFVVAAALFLSLVAPHDFAPAATGQAELWTAPGPGVVHSETGQPGEDIYIVLLQTPSLAQYRGGIPSLPATSPVATGDTRLDTNSATSVAYLSYLAALHDGLVADIEFALGRNVEVLYHYDAVLNGVAVKMDQDEALEVASLRGVRKVTRNEPRELLTDNGPRWIGADAIWGEDPVSGICNSTANSSCGEGVIVGVIDTGINHDHPSFAEVGPVDGYVHANPRPTFLGLCDPITGAPFCNDKLIGYYDFTAEPGGPDDLNGHGSHTASTAAGNVVDVVLEAPTTTFTRRISGVAPHANIIAYKACGAEPSGILGCFPTLAPLLAAINVATLDQVDVINYSIGGGSGNPWVDDDAQAFFDAYTAGIFVATSAGNSGPGAATLGSPADAPWVTSVGASTHDRKLSNGIVNMAGPGAPADIFGKSLTAPLAAARVVYAGDYAAESSDPPNAGRCGAGVGDPATGQGSGGDPWPPGTFNGEIVVCDRGEYGRVFKGQYVKNAGAGGYVLANDAANGNSLIGDPHVLPGVHISFADGVVLKAWIANNGGKNHGGTGQILGTSAQQDPGSADSMAGFSSRGPNPSVPDVVKPDVTAPGVDILAAFHTPIGTLPGSAPEFGIISGTSMSSPHTAGAGALVIGARPTWTVDQVKSALMSTAFTKLPAVDTETHGVFKENGSTPADPFDMGGGRIDLRQAARAGLILNVGAAAYDAANPGSGGEPSTLNIASFGQDACLGTCSWTRTVEATVAASWLASTTAPAGMTLTVSPGSFSLAAGQTQVITVTANVSGVTPKNVWTFAEVKLTANNPAIPATHFPVAVIPKSDAPPTGEVLHLHGNSHDDCGFSGDGRADLLAGCAPFMSPDPQLDPDAPAARWGPLSPALSGTAPQNIYDPNWIWVLDEETTLAGPMVVEWWAAGPLSTSLVTEDFNIRLFADGVLVVAQRVSHNIVTPNVAQLLSSTVSVPQVTATTNFVVQIDPVFIDSQQGSFIYYDSVASCPGASGECDSRIRMPVVRGPQPPVANDDSAFVINGGAVDIDVLANDFDPEGGPLVVQVISGPTNGTATVTFAKTIQYTHNGSATTSDSFQYRITDNQGLTDTATVTITVSEECFVSAGNSSDNFETGAPGWTVETLVLTPPSQTWQLLVDPFASSPTSDWFTDALAQDGLSDTTKDVRLISPSQLVSENTHLRFFHRFSTEPSFDGGVLEVRIDGGIWQDVQAAGGVFVAGGYNSTLSSGGFSLGGRSAWSGDSSGFLTGLMNQVDVDLGALAGQDIQVRFRFGQDQLFGQPGGWWIDDVSFSNLYERCTEPPNAQNDSASVAPGGVVNINVKANDSDPDTNVADLTVSIEPPGPSHGSAVVLGNGTVDYTHNGDAAYSDSFQYRVTDPDGNFDIATVSITINQVNPAPVAEDDFATVDQGGSVTIDVKANDSDANHTNAQLTVSVETTPSHGVAGVTPDGKITYTHNGNSATSDSFQYRVTDPGDKYDVATVHITIEPSPEACRTELCANKVKPVEMTLTFVGGSCAESANTQGSKASCTDYASGAHGDVFVKATNKADAGYASAKVFFVGPLSEGETFTLMAQNAGEKDFGSQVYLHLYSSDGTTLLQSVRIHTSCSAPLIEGEQFGALKLGEANTNPNAPVCTVGEGRVHGSGFWNRGSGEKYDKIDFSFEARHQKGTLKGKLKVHDKALDVKIDAKTITSLTTGQGLACDGVVLNGANSFAFTAEGTFEFNDTKSPATFRACGIDNGKNNEPPFDFLYVTCVGGCSYNTGDRTPDSTIDGGNIHLHDPITNPN